MISKNIYIDYILNQGERKINNEANLQAEYFYFNSKESFLSISNNLEGCDIKLYQQFKCGEFDISIMKLQLMLELLRRKSVNNISYYAPFLPYLRQDNEEFLIDSCGFNVVMNILTYYNVKNLYTCDMHSKKINKDLKLKITNLSMIPFFIQDIVSKFDTEKLIIILPDKGSLLRYSEYDLDNLTYITCNKTRDPYNIEILINRNDIENMNCVILDDMIDSGETILKTTDKLLEKKASKVFVYATHGLFSNNAIEKIEQSSIQNVVVTNSLISDNLKQTSKTSLFNIDVLNVF